MLIHLIAADMQPVQGLAPLLIYFFPIYDIAALSHDHIVLYNVLRN